MRVKSSGILMVAAVMLLYVSQAFPCSVVNSASGVQIPIEIVGQSELILRATAVRQSAPLAGRPDLTKVHFTVEETVKGTYAAKEIVLPGALSSTDDFNDRPGPYDFVRREGRRGNCFADTYRTGAQFLLMLKRTGPGTRYSDTEYTVNWYALGPVNEQLRSATDPWLVWVKQQLAKK
jgi:hypothetical protein